MNSRNADFTWMSTSARRRWEGRRGVFPCQIPAETVRGILSVDISDWEAPGEVFGKPARECSAKQIKEEVWTQLKHHVNSSEAANEAARRAVNCLLLASGSTAPPAQLWPLEEPAFLKPIQEIDRIRFRLRLPHHLAAL